MKFHKELKKNLELFSETNYEGYCKVILQKTFEVISGELSKEVLEIFWSSWGTKHFMNVSLKVSVFFFINKGISQKNIEGITNEIFWKITKPLMGNFLK